MPVSSRYPCEGLGIAEGASQYHTDYKDRTGLKMEKIFLPGLKWVMGVPS